MASGITRGERLQIMLTKREVQALDNWRFERRMPSRASAIRELLKRGLAAEGFDTASTSQHSRDFGVVDGASRRQGAADD
jgi:hypothetical protein